MRAIVAEVNRDPMSPDREKIIFSRLSAKLFKNLLDERTQMPLNKYLSRELDVDYVDTITEVGPVRIIAEQQDSHAVQSIFNRVDISIGKHDSKSIALVAHHDCVGNPVSQDEQLKQLKTTTEWLTRKYPDVQVLGLWIDSTWTVTRVC